MSRRQRSASRRGRKGHVIPKVDCIDPLPRHSIDVRPSGPPSLPFRKTKKNATITRCNEKPTEELISSLTNLSLKKSGYNTDHRSNKSHNETLPVGRKIKTQPRIAHKSQQNQPPSLTTKRYNSRAPVTNRGTKTAATALSTRTNTRRATDVIRANLVSWTKQVFATVGPGRKEVCYQTELKDLLLREGLDVAVETPLKFQRLVPAGCTPGQPARREPGGSNAPTTTAVVAKRADLIVSLPGRLERVLIECKAKPRFTRGDFLQVMCYRHHFGIEDCYLVNFCGSNEEDVQISKLRA